MCFFERQKQSRVIKSRATKQVGNVIISYSADLDNSA